MRVLLTGSSWGAIGRSRRKGSNGERAWARSAADVTSVLVRRSELGEAIVQSSASELKPLRSASRRVHASAGGRQLTHRELRRRTFLPAAVALLPIASVTRSATV